MKTEVRLYKKFILLVNVQTIHVNSSHSS